MRSLTKTQTLAAIAAVLFFIAGLMMIPVTTAPVWQVIGLFVAAVLFSGVALYRPRKKRNPV